MSKKSSQKLPRAPSKRQISHWEQQRRRQGIILISGIVVIAAIALILVAGWFVTLYQPLHETVITVNDTSFNMQYFIDVLKAYGSGQDSSSMSYIATIAIRDIEQNELIREEAANLGISVTDSELSDQMKEANLPNSEAIRDLIKTQMLANKLRSDYFDKQIPQTMAQRQVMAMLLETEAQASEVRARLEAGEDFAKIAGDLSLDDLTKTKKGDLGWHPQNVLAQMMSSQVPVDYAFGSEPGTLSQPRYDADVQKRVGYWLIKVTQRNQDATEAGVQAMLLGSEEEANSVRARLQAGEDFATLAKQFSQLSDVQENGGDQGLVAPKDKTPAFDGYVFGSDMKIGEVSAPVRDDTVGTKGGYWLIKVVAADSNRELSQEDRDTLISKALQDWVSSLWLKPENVINDKPLTDETTGREKVAWAIARALKK